MKYNFDIWILKISKLNRLLLVLLSFFASALSAKDFQIISVDDFELYESLLFFNEKGPHKFNLRKYYANVKKPIPRNNRLYLFSVNKDSKEVSKTPTLSIQLNKQKADTIILLKKGISVDEFDYQIIQNDAQSFPPLTAYIFNNMDKTVLLKMGETIFKIDPKSQKFIPLPENNKGYFDEKMVFATQKVDKSIDYFYSSYWRVYSESKKLCFIDFDEATEEHTLTEITLR